MKERRLTECSISLIESDCGDVKVPLVAYNSVYISCYIYVCQGYVMISVFLYDRLINELLEIIPYLFRK